jgi:hypothetical protein
VKSPARQNATQDEKAKDHPAGLPQGPPQGEPRRGNRTARPSGKVPGRAQVEKSIRSQTRKGRSEKPAFFISY